MHAQRTALRPFEHTGDSANIAFYRERGAKSTKPYVWAEVLCSALVFKKGEPARAKRHADYRITVYHSRTRAPIAEFTYTPKRRTDHPGGAGPLSTRTVARLVREALDAAL